MAPPINTVVIGYGYAGERIHVPLIALEPQLHLHGICSSDAEKRARITSTLHCQTYASFDEVLADRAVALVILATPNALHATQALEAMTASKHVVVDKPMCLSTPNARALIDCSNQCRRVLTVFHNRRLDGDYLTLRQLLAQGKLGNLRWLEMAWQRFGPPRTWKQQASQGGGRLWDLGSHLIDQILQLFPADVSSVHARMHHDWGDRDIESHAQVTLSFSDGSSAVIDTGSMSHLPKPRILAIGDQATFMKHGTDPQEAALAQGHIDQATEDPADWGTWSDGKTTTRIQTVPGDWRLYYKNLAKVLKTDEPYANRNQLLVKPEQALKVIAVLQAAHRSAATGHVAAV